MEPITIGTIILAIGGPASVIASVYKYGQLNQRVTDLEAQVSKLEKQVSNNAAANDLLVSNIVENLASFKNDIIDRLARIETKIK